MTDISTSLLLLSFCIQLVAWPELPFLFLFLFLLLFFSFSFFCCYCSCCFCLFQLPWWLAKACVTPASGLMAQSAPHHDICLGLCLILSCRMAAYSLRSSSTYSSSMTSGYWRDVFQIMLQLMWAVFFFHWWVASGASWAFSSSVSGGSTAFLTVFLTFSRLVEWFLCFGGMVLFNHCGVLELGWFGWWYVPVFICSRQEEGAMEGVCETYYILLKYSSGIVPRQHVHHKCCSGTGQVWCWVSVSVKITSLTSCSPVFELFAHASETVHILLTAGKCHPYPATLPSSFSNHYHVIFNPLGTWQIHVQAINSPEHCQDCPGWPGPSVTRP